MSDVSLVVPVPRDHERKGTQVYQWIVRTVLVSLIGTAGCSYSVALPDYALIVRGAEDANVSVALQVQDGRAPEQGGTDKAAVGQLRGGFGNPFPLSVTDSQRVTALVQAATADALRLARVSVRPGGDRALIATVKTFWIDGYMGYKATVAVDLALHDAQGNVLWRGAAKGEGGGVAVWTPTGFVPGTFQRALNAYAEDASGSFGRPEFQKNLY